MACAKPWLACTTIFLSTGGRQGHVSLLRIQGHTHAISLQRRPNFKFDDDDDDGDDDDDDDDGDDDDYYDDDEDDDDDDDEDDDDDDDDDNNDDYNEGGRLLKVDIC